MGQACFAAVCGSSIINLGFDTKTENVVICNDPIVMSHTEESHSARLLELRAEQFRIRRLIHEYLQPGEHHIVEIEASIYAA
jgi:hypothetical protein